MEPELIWNSKLDDRFYCRVIRSDTPYKGILEVTDHLKDDELIYKSLVALAYNAEYGPDVDDVAAWEEKIVDFIDNTYQG